MIVAEAELCKEVGIRQFKSIANRSLPAPIAGSPLHQKGLFFTRSYQNILLLFCFLQKMVEYILPLLL